MRLFFSTGWDYKRVLSVAVTYGVEVAVDFAAYDHLLVQLELVALELIRSTAAWLLFKSGLLQLSLASGFR